jgi:hypothetical protein
VTRDQTHGARSSEGNQRDLSVLKRRVEALYEALIALPRSDVERRRAIWSEIIEIQHRITVLLPPDIHSLFVADRELPAGGSRPGHSVVRPGK